MLDEFVAKYGEGFTDKLIEEVFDCLDDSSKSSRVSVIDKHELNILNHVYEGCVYVGNDEEEWSFQIESGNNNGTVILQWCREEESTPFEPPKPTRFRLVPRNDNLQADKPAMYDVYLGWKNEEWFQDLERSYNYDRHFSPTNKIETHYREKAAARGLKFTCEESE